MSEVSTLFIPLIILVIFLYAIIKKVNGYDSFCIGAKEGIMLSVQIFPFLMAMIFGMNLLLEGGIITDFFSYLKPILSRLFIPVEILPMAIIRPISGNASFVVMMDIIKTYGVDSYMGRLASILQGATDTTIYVISLYFGTIGIKNIKYALKAGLLVDLITFFMAIFLVSIFF